MPREQGSGAGEGRPVPGRIDPPQRRGETALPDDPPVKGRGNPVQFRLCGWYQETAIRHNGSGCLDRNSSMQARTSPSLSSMNSATLSMIAHPRGNLWRRRLRSRRRLRHSTRRGWYLLQAAQVQGRDVYLDKLLYAVGQLVVASKPGHQLSAPCLQPTAGMELENRLSSVQTRRYLVPGELQERRSLQRSVATPAEGVLQLGGHLRVCEVGERSSGGPNS